MAENIDDLKKRIEHLENDLSAAIGYAKKLEDGCMELREVFLKLEHPSKVWVTFFCPILLAIVNLAYHDSGMGTIDKPQI